jgi:hypothetical protein
MSHPDPVHENNAAYQYPAASEHGHWGVGLAIALGCIGMVIPLAFVVGGIASLYEPMGALLGVFVAAGFGLSQWLFVVPMGLYLRHKGKLDTAMGLWITAGVAMLLNGACFGLMTLPGH